MDLSLEALTYDDVLLTPQFSQILPRDVQLKTKFSRNISMNIPLVSAAMDTVTEAQTAIVMAQEGGIGVIHKNLSHEEQALEVERVKKYESGLIDDPITVAPEDPILKVIDLTARYKISGVPVTNKAGHLVGIITNRDLRFETNYTQQVSDVMTRENLVTAPVGTTLSQAKVILQKYRIEKLPIVSKNGLLKGLITVKDIEKARQFPNANKDSVGRLRVAAAIGVGDQEFERAQSLVNKNVDALVVDTAHGHSAGVVQMLKRLKKSFSQDIIVGNVATGAACNFLIENGVDGIKVGIGPGSICTTRVIAGIGVPQLTALFQAYETCNKFGVPYIADGGVKFSGDAVKALAAGANSVMIGSLLAGTDESPGEMILYKGKSYKVYRGMGSLGAMSQGSRDRYNQGEITDIGKLVPEGVEGQVPYRGPLSNSLYQLTGGIRSGMGYLGAENLLELKEKAEFMRVSRATVSEGHPHGIIVTKEPSNYRPFNRS